MRPHVLGSLFAALLAVPSFAATPVPPAAELVLERSIAYHDPQGLWPGSRFRLEIEETRPDGSSRHTRVQFDNSLGSFEFLSQRDGVELEGLLADGDCLWTLDGSTEFSEAQRQQYRLTCERLGWIRNYYTYLWGLPMKLRDPGTRLDQLAIADSYQDRRVWAIRVTYDEAVGRDTWYFYFDREDYRLVGYRFYHDEAANDGEFIVLDGEVEASHMRIPRQRAWYTHGDARHLGDDVLVELVVEPGR